MHFAILPPLRHTALALTLAGLLAGCMAGPDYVRPAAPTATGYTATPLPAHTASAAGAVQAFAPAAAPDAEWWRAFGSPELDGLVARALRDSPTLAAAEAKLREAGANQAAQAGATYLPRVDAGVGAQRQRFNPNLLGQAGTPREFDLYTANVGVHYRLDLGGGNRRALEALAARTDYQRYQLEATRLTLAASVVGTAINRAQLADQIAATEALLRDEDARVALLRAQLRLGHATPDALAALQAEAEQDRAGLPALQQSFDQSGHRLAVLTGQPPAEANLPTLTLADLHLPRALPVVVPSELVRRRPDIGAAEALLHAATADYGVAVAKAYPQLDLSASLGSQALSTGALFGSGAAVWSLLAQLTQPLFDPALPAKKRAALAAVDAAGAQYQGVVLDALREVADALRASQHDAETVAALQAADTAARDRLAIATRRHALGAAADDDVLQARIGATHARRQLDAGRGARLASTLQLFQAMGNSQPPVARATSPAAAP
ncbi:MAG: efflux transporter outer membrane subunit [Rhodanobacter sp.]|nr:MAG: efflux transporter outer membrane subunit [Rhodanobacter sp.]TAM08454.1 MAG: efflux transporter outer membrane subunit [Rhodanobacter sp.]TAM36582.1 MAG: efflux transporter outer membrane subunit [Rhodanobacter sp.]